jgi:hypothetical protein
MSHYSVAQAKLAEFLEEHRDRVSNGNSEVSAKMTFGEALKIHRQNQADDATIKPRGGNAGTGFCRLAEKLAGLGGSGTPTHYENEL